MNRRRRWLIVPLFTVALLLALLLLQATGVDMHGLLARWEILMFPAGLVLAVLFASASVLARYLTGSNQDAHEAAEAEHGPGSAATAQENDRRDDNEGGGSG